MTLIRLLKDRKEHQVKDNGKRGTFLFADDYELVREVGGLGWLVRTNKNNKRKDKKPLTLIRYRDGFRY